MLAHSAAGLVDVEALERRGPGSFELLWRDEHSEMTLHVYAPPLRAIGDYDIVDGELHRSAGPADEVSEPSPGLTEALAD